MAPASTFLLAMAPSTAVFSSSKPRARTFMPVANMDCSASRVPGGSSRAARTAISCCCSLSWSSSATSSLRESLAGSFMRALTFLPRASESLIAAPTPAKYVR